MWNICRSQCSTPRLFRPDRVENHLTNSRQSSLFSSSWFSSTIPLRTIQTPPNSIRNSNKNILNSTDLFSIENSTLKTSSNCVESPTESVEIIIHQQPGHLKDELSNIHQQLNTPLSASMITLQNVDHSTQSTIKMSSQELSSGVVHKSNESEYQRSFIWNGSQQSVVREHPPHDHDIMSVSQDSVLYHNNLSKAPVQVGHGSGVLFSIEHSIDLKNSHEPERVSEYHSKFKPFSDYVYVADEHRFREQTSASKLATAAAQGSGSDITPAGKSWFSEVEERNQDACKYRARSQNGSTPIDPEWKGIRSRDSDFIALALANQLTIAEKRAQRASRSSSAKPSNRSSRKELNSAPASLIDATTPMPKLRPVKARTVNAPPKSTPTAPSTDRNNNAVKPETKVWIKPKKKEDNTAETKKHDTSDKNQPKAVPRAVKKNPEESLINVDAQVVSVPLHTTQIKSPEEITGVKSPPPEAWKISIEKGNLEWVHTESPVNFDKNGHTDSTDILKPVAINGSKN